jgi:hypothetical protein
MNPTRDAMARAAVAAGLPADQARELANNVLAALHGLTADDREEITTTILAALDHRCAHADVYGNGYDRIDRVALCVEMSLVFINSLRAEEVVCP